MKLLGQLCILMVCFFLYLTFGAIVFHLLESSNETKVRGQLLQFFQDFKIKHKCIDNGELKDLVLEVIRATENGVFRDMKYEKVNNTNIKPSEYQQWDIFNSFFFSSTVITTIGYGNLCPKTIGGRTFCIVYALIGIPLTGWLLNVIGKYFVESWKSLVNRIISKCSMLSNVRVRKIAVYLTVGCLMYTLTIIIPSLIFMVIENWSFFDSQYFCLISLTTIGFGEYVISNNPDMSVAVRAIYKILAVVYLVFGLSVLMITLKVIGDMETKNARTFGSLSQKLKRQVLSASDKFRFLNGNRGSQGNGCGENEALPTAFRSTIYNSEPETMATTEHV
ncbi:potassium channel subfamily K member 16-like [Anneissia japonica]|uniref:potassium channel subfamily K member 16-like n=1 Tax=Anneissia japonica TaxID=1529436 RepID=UPI0014255508|nr:potassium channel subfamily K member 16-like [Anneissia japonica]